MPTFSSNQEIFNYVYLNLIRQGRPAINEETGTCVLKDKYGNKCAFGWLIPDGKSHSSTSECYFVDFLVKEDVIPSARTNYIFLTALQLAHDEGASSEVDKLTWLEGFKSRMEEIAKLYSLEMPTGETQ